MAFKNTRYVNASIKKVVEPENGKRVMCRTCGKVLKSESEECNCGKRGKTPSGDRAN